MCFNLDAQRLAQLGVQVRERLIHQEDARLAHDGAPNRDPLHLAAGKLGRLALQEMADAQHFGGFAYAALDLVFRRAAHRRAQRKGQVVVDRHGRIERILLEDKGNIALGGRSRVDRLAVEEDAPLILFFQPSDHAQRSGFARAGGPQEHEELAVMDLKRNVA